MHVRLCKFGSQAHKSQENLFKTECPSFIYRWCEASASSSSTCNRLACTKESLSKWPVVAGMIDSEVQDIIETQTYWWGANRSIYMWPSLFVPLLLLPYGTACFFITSVNTEICFFRGFWPKRLQKLVKMGKKPLKLRNYGTKGGFCGNYFGLSVGRTPPNG